MTLLRLDSRPIPAAPGECRSFTVVRNELARLPGFLDHHRKIGINRFFFIDNISTDGSDQYLLAQPDCHVFRAEGAFREANQGVAWIEALMAEHGQGCWRLYIDSDELFLFPHAERLQLRDFCAFLERDGADGVFAFLLDMYSQGPIHAAVHQPDRAFFETCPLFDRDYSFKTRPRIPGVLTPFPPFEVFGGPRIRVFYPQFAKAGPLDVIMPRLLIRARRHRLARKIGLGRLRWGNVSPPLLNKIPLTFGRPGIQYLTNHKTAPLRLASVTGVLMHFKYFSDFHERSETARLRGQHFNGSSEYARYMTILQRDPDMSFAYSGSQHYNSTQQLVDLGLLKSSVELDELQAAPPVAEISLPAHALGALA